MQDVIIIGCGPAGLTAAIYLLRSGKKVLLFECESIGGQIASSPLVENFPGFLKISGVELSNNLYEQVVSLGGEIEFEKVVKVTKDKEVIVENGNVYKAKAIIIATGAKYKLLGLENEEDYLGNGISFCTTCDAPFYKNKVVAVIGAGSSALTNALYLTDFCTKVYLIHRNENFRGEKYLLEKLKEKDNSEIITSAKVIKYLGKDSLEGIIIEKENIQKEIKLDGLFLSIGHEAQNELLKDLIDMSENNYALSNENCTTNIEGVFVAGDIRDKKIRQLTTAVADGTVAALNAEKYIEELEK